MEVEPIPLVVTATLNDNHNLLLIGGTFAAGLVGALVGVLGTFVTLTFQRKYELDKRYFEARKEAYTKAISIFTFALIERDKKRIRVEAEAAAKAVGEDVHKVMAQLNLFSSVKLSSDVRTLFSTFDTNPPALGIPDAEFGQIKLRWQAILDQMRQELGLEPYLLSEEVRDVLSNPTSRHKGSLKKNLIRFLERWIPYSW